MIENSSMSRKTSISLRFTQTSFIQMARKDSSSFSSFFSAPLIPLSSTLSGLHPIQFQSFPSICAKQLQDSTTYMMNGLTIGGLPAAPALIPSGQQKKGGRSSLLSSSTSTTEHVDQDVHSQKEILSHGKLNLGEDILYEKSFRETLKSLIFQEFQ